MRAPGEKVVNSQAARITVLRRSDVADDVTGIVGDVLMDKCSQNTELTHILTRRAFPWRELRSSSNFWLKLEDAPFVGGMPEAEPT
jgi:hypothetical protein